MSQTLKPIAPIRDPQMDKMVRDLYARVGRLEPEVARLGQRVVGVSQEVAKVAAERGLRWDVFSEGIPQPKNGDAVHLDPSTGVIYRANALTRTAVIGVKDGSGRVVGSGSAKGLSGLTVGADYYLQISNVTSGAVGYSDPPDKVLNLRYDAAAYAQSQSFTVSEVGALAEIMCVLRKYGSPTYNLRAVLRNDDGTGKPGTTILAVSDIVPASEVLSGAAQSVYFTFYTSYILQIGTVYHIHLEADVTTVNSIDYIGVSAKDAGTYANGQSCVSNSSDVWATDGTDDWFFAVYYHKINDTTGSNLSATHPFTSLEVLPLIRSSIIKVGKAVSTTELFVNISIIPIKILLLDYTTTISAVGTAVTTVKFADVNTYGVSRIFLHYRLKTSNLSFLAYAKPGWSGVKAAAYLSTNATVFSVSGMTTGLYYANFANSFNSVNTLAFDLYNADPAGITTVGMVVVVGV